MDEVPAHMSGTPAAAATSRHPCENRERQTDEQPEDCEPPSAHEGRLTRFRIYLCSFYGFVHNLACLVFLSLASPCSDASELARAGVSPQFQPQISLCGLRTSTETHAWKCEEQQT